ncbi:uncharacterized protein LAESUDRAFT_747637 [Laetiporus sulphureus 93-53]|uniref:DUF6534 domain-containing protein n=1 Tax=Laetiporus sulphureus 93-53 TaxID=1314785 RepID=A0A165GDU9_9APHY|nr:uncharacterized protein LAESUDRAFT_747637 [Laetiporus sulphureus 93-53]KZT10209.1 hypothetical protein LAESUDRAFT_747637 [Laetiporus sulphureus 93-53]
MTSIALIAGPQFLGICFNWALLGLLNLQVYLYYDYFPKDPWLLKCLAYGMLIYEWVQTGLITEAAMSIYVYNYGEVKDLLEFHNTWFSATMMCGIISATVQLYFAWRICKLSNSRVLAGIIVVLSVLQCVASLVAGGIEKSIGIAYAIESKLIKAVVLWLSASALVDVLIAVTMTTLLLKSKTGITSTDALINRMVRLVVETGTLTASLSIIVLITAKIEPLYGTLVYEAPLTAQALMTSSQRADIDEDVRGLSTISVAFVSPIHVPRYSNTFLTNLNNRKFIRRRDATMIELVPMSELHFAQNVTVQHVETSTRPVMESSTSDAASVAFVRKGLGAPCNGLTFFPRSVLEAQTKRPVRRNSVV